MVSDVHRSERGDEVHSDQAAQEQVSHQPFDSPKPEQTADVFDPGLEPEMVLVPPGSNDYEVFYEPEIRRPPRRATWSEDHPALKRNLPTFTLTLALILVGLILLSTLLFAPNGDSDVIAGPDADSSDTAAEIDESTARAIGSNDGRISRKKPTADTTGSGRSSEVMASPNSTTTTDPATSEPRSTITTAAATSETTPTTSNGRGSLPTTIDIGPATDSSVPKPRILQFGNRPAPGEDRCPEGQSPYDAIWNSINTDEVRLTLPGGTVVSGAPIGGQRLCGVPGQQMTLRVLGPGGTATAVTVLV